MNNLAQKKKFTRTSKQTKHEIQCGRRHAMLLIVFNRAFHLRIRFVGHFFGLRQFHLKSIH